MQVQVGGQVVRDETDGLSRVHIGGHGHQGVLTQAHEFGVASAHARPPGRPSYDLPRLERSDGLADHVNDSDDVLAKGERDGLCARESARAPVHEGERRNACSEDLHSSLGGSRFGCAFLDDGEHIRVSGARHDHATVLHLASSSLGPGSRITLAHRPLPAGVSDVQHMPRCWSFPGIVPTAVRGRNRRSSGTGWSTRSPLLFPLPDDDSVGICETRRGTLRDAERPPPIPCQTQAKGPGRSGACHQRVSNVSGSCGVLQV